MKFQIQENRCTGCGKCQQQCHGWCISALPSGKRVIDSSRCLECGSCMTVCSFGAILEEGDTYEWEPHETTQLSADLVVLGSGGAGYECQFKSEPRDHLSLSHL